MTNTEFSQNHYHNALAALVEIAPNLPVIQALRRGPNPYNTEKLAYLLDKHNFFYQVPQPTSSAFEERLAKMRKQRGMPEPSAVAPEAPKEEPLSMELTEELTYIRDHRKNLFKKASFLHANKLEDPTLSNKERSYIAFEILDIHDNQIPALDAEEKYIMEHKKLPFLISTDAPKETEPKEAPAPALINSTDKLEVYKRMETLKKNIGRDKRKFPERAEKYQAELNLLKAKYDSM